MLSELFLFCLLSSVTSFPQPSHRRQSKGYTEFTLPDVVGVKDVRFVYRCDGKEEQDIGHGVKGVDRVWRHLVNKLICKNKLTYRAEAMLTNGETHHTDHLVWMSEPIMKLPPQRMRGVVIFRDDFNGNSVDTNNWLIQVTANGGSHDQFQVFTNDPRNIFVRDGFLFLNPTLTIDSGHFTEQDLHTGIMNVTKTWGECTNPAYDGCYRDAKHGLLPPALSGEVWSYPTLKYGTVTVRAQIPKGDWLGSAIWMLPTNSTYGGWPRSGEIDFMEAISNEVAYWDDGEKVGIQRVSSTLHFGPDRATDHPVRGSLTKSEGDWHEGFHIYTLDWSPDHLILSVDGVVATRMDIPDGSSVWDKYKFNGTNIWENGSKIAPFDQEFYMILNLAVGGHDTEFGDDTHYAYPKPWNQYDIDPLAAFWAHRNEWMPSWKGENVAFIIDYVEFRSM